jgi:pimeloyl-ACP methyl ester carboxylesterase
MTSLRSLWKLGAAACLAAIAACQTTPSSAPPVVKYMDVNGAWLPWVEQGRGAPVVFVHGAVSDYRTWDRHRSALAGSGYRAMAYSQRYFGTEPWGENWPAFGVQTHADDLAAFIRGLHAGPVHLVAWSHSGHTVLNVALKNPELVQSAFVFEPAEPTYVSDPAELKALGDDAGVLFGPVAEAVKARDNAAAVSRLIDGVGERKGYFDALPAAARAVHLDSARTMPLLMNQAPAPPISCAQLGQIKPRVALVRGADVRPFFKVAANAGARCMPSQQYIVVPNAKHMWPGEDVADFNRRLVAFLKAE